MIFTVALCLVDAIQNDLTLLWKNIHLRKLKFQNNKLLLETIYLSIIGGSLNILAAERFLVISLSLLKFYDLWVLRFIFMKNNLKIVRYSCTTKREIERIVTILQSLVWKWDSMKLHETRNSLINSMIWKGTQQWNNFIFENLNITLAYNRRSWYIREATYWFDSCYSYWQYINNIYTQKEEKIFFVVYTT